MHLLYRIVYNLVTVQLRVLHRIQVEGREHVPKGGCLIVANHASYLDPTTVGWAVEREIFYLGRKTLFRPPVMNWLLPWCNVLPIDRDGRDMSGLRRIIKMLKDDKAVLLFPEGTRTPDGRLQRGQPGAGLVALKAGVPVLPVRLFGTFECLSRHSKKLKLLPLRVVIGRPYLPSQTATVGDKEAYDQVAQEMMARLAALT